MDSGTMVGISVGIYHLLNFCLSKEPIQNTGDAGVMYKKQAAPLGVKSTAEGSPSRARRSVSRSSCSLALRRRISAVSCGRARLQCSGGCCCCRSRKRCRTGNANSSSTLGRLLSERCCVGFCQLGLRTKTTESGERQPSLRWPRSTLPARQRHMPQTNTAYCGNDSRFRARGRPLPEADQPGFRRCLVLGRRERKPYFRLSFDCSFPEGQMQKWFVSLRCHARRTRTGKYVNIV